MKFLDEISLKEPVEEFLHSGTSGSSWNPSPQIQALNIILGEFLDELRCLLVIYRPIS